MYLKDEDSDFCYPLLLEWFEKLTYMEEEIWEV